MTIVIYEPLNQKWSVCYTKSSLSNQKPRYFHNMEILMKYIALIGISFCIGTSCQGMQLLDFTKFSREIGVEKGKKEAEHCLPSAVTKNDVLRPLVKELTSAAKHLVLHPEAKSSFEGFVVGFGIVLFTNNEKRKQCKQAPFTFDSTLVSALLTDIEPEDKREKESREKLIQLLTVKLTEMKLLV